MEMTTTTRIFRLSELAFNWKSINSANHLRCVLEQATCRLRALGHTEMAAEWQRRLSVMPSRMGKEAINCVLLMACRELEQKEIFDAE